MDQAGLCTFIEIERWIEHLFNLQCREVPKGWTPLTLHQLIAADKALFIHASENLAGSLTSVAGAPKPFDLQIKQLMYANEIVQHLTLLPKAEPPHAPSSYGSQDRDSGKGKGKAGKGKSGKADAGKVTLPPGCVSKTDKNKPIFFAFNRGKCPKKGGGTSDDPESFAKQILDSGEVKREKILELVRKLPGLRSRRHGDNPTSNSFVTGAYVFSEMTGLCNSFKTFPLCSRVLASFVQGVDPLHTFSSVAVFEDIAAPVHRDAHNDYDSINLIYALSDFKLGGLVVEHEFGKHEAFQGDELIRGKVLPFRDRIIRFNASKVRHWTQDWEGRRVILVAYTVRSLEKLKAEDLQALQDSGFRLPHDSASPTSSLQPPAAFEIFAGRGCLSLALRDEGFDVVSIDKRSGGSLVPIVLLDLASEKGQDMCWELLHARHPKFIQSPPCATCSMRLSFRSAENPLGLKTEGAAKSKVENENVIFRFLVKVIAWAMQHKILFSVEVPLRSWAWAAITEVVRQDSATLASRWSALHEVSWDVCMHGGPRAKTMRLVSNQPAFVGLQAACVGGHQHDPWIPGGFEDCRYPPLLSSRWAAMVRSSVNAAYPFPRGAPRLKDLTSAFLGVQTRKTRRLMSEFKDIRRISAAEPVPIGCKRLLPSTSDEGGDVGAEVGAKLGVWRSPAEFFQEAIKLSHPLDFENPLEPATVRAVDDIFQRDPKAVDLKRKTNLLKVKIMAKKPEKDEEKLHKGLPASVESVVKDKKILIFRRLLEQEGYDDVAAADILVEGVRVVGSSPHPCGYDHKLVPASLTEGELRRTASSRRRALEASSRVFNREHARHLSEVTKDEAEHGFLEGPLTASEVTETLGTSEWGIVPRFILVQGSEGKLRPIDDCAVCQINAACTTSIRLHLHDSDYISALALSIAEKAKACGGGDLGHWCGKTLDLSKAYKQLPLSPVDRDLCVGFYLNEDGTPSYFVPNALMFGSVAAVYAFNRVSKALWYLITKLLVIPAAVYYDDYPLFSPRSSAGALDGFVSDFLDCLGFGHAKTGSKGLPFQPSFNVLGINIDLGRISEGIVSLKNKPGRIDRICREFDKMVEDEALTLHHSQVLHGLLNFAGGFYSGRGVKHLGSDLLDLRRLAAAHDFAKLRDLAERAREVLHGTPPRELRCDFIREPICVWTDGSWEDGESGIGAVVYDCLTREGRVFAGAVPDAILRRWIEEMGSPDEPALICQIELYAVVLLRFMLRRTFCNRRVLIFVDNDAARFCLIKGLSRSSTMSSLIEAFDSLDGNDPMLYWIERVASFSNIADGPSRGTSGDAMNLVGASEAENFSIHEDLSRLLLSRKRRGK
eukprot:s2715_g10.t2